MNESAYAIAMHRLARKEGRIAAPKVAAEKQATKKSKRAAKGVHPRRFYFDPTAVRKPKPRRAPAYERFIAFLRENPGATCADMAEALMVKKTRLWQFAHKARSHGVKIDTVQISNRVFAYRIAE